MKKSQNDLSEIINHAVALLYIYKKERIQTYNFFCSYSEAVVEARMCTRVTMMFYVHACVEIEVMENKESCHFAEHDIHD